MKKVITPNYLFLFILFFFFCTELSNPFEEMDLVAITVSVADKPNGYEWCANEDITFTLTINYPKYVERIVANFGENGEIQYCTLSTNSTQDTVIQYVYNYPTTGVKHCEFSLELTGSNRVPADKCTLDVGLAPTLDSIQIFGQPVIGGSFNLIANHTGFGDYEFIWSRDSVVISGQNKHTLAFYNSDQSHSGIYTCAIVSKWGQDESNPYNLQIQTVVDKPIIVIHPTNKSVTQGKTALFSVHAKGENLTYQWQRDEQDIPNAMLEQYETDTLQLGDDGRYQCIVTNTFGSVTSNPAILTVVAGDIPPTISKQPQDQEAPVGKTAIFFVEAEGTDLQYQWYGNGELIANATSNVYVTPPVAVIDSGKQYHCIISNSLQSVESNKVILSVIENIPKPIILSQPQDVEVTVNHNANLAIGAMGSNLQFQWRMNDQDINGATNPVYTHINAQLGDNGARFVCLITNSAGTVTSDVAILTVRDSEIAPQITVQPQNMVVTKGKSPLFSVSAIGTNLIYQWKRNQVDIPNANQNYYTFANAQESDDGARFSCVVSNSLGSVTSNEAGLTVTASVTPPVITNHPQSIEAVVGSNALFSITAQGADLQYQWLQNDVAMSGANGPQYLRKEVKLEDNGLRIRCIVANSAGELASNEASLTVIEQAIPPQITIQPQDITVTVDNDAQFQIKATGTNLQFQWQMNQQNIIGAITDIYIHKNAKKEDDGAIFQCLVANSEGQVLSDSAILAVTDSITIPVISVQPRDTTVFVGNDAPFSITANGANLVFQWQMNNVDIPGATQSLYTHSNAQKADSGNTFLCLVSNSAGQVPSAAAILSVNDAIIPPAITVQPTAQNVLEGQDATFTVEATGSNLTYQWQEDTTDIPQANANTYTKTAVQASDNGKKYRCVVTNNVGQVISEEAELIVGLKPPTITVQPTPQSVLEGEDATFTIEATGVNISFQWQENAVDIPGATAKDYTKNNVQVGDNGKIYRCVVTNSAGQVTSDEVALTVTLNPPAITVQPQDQQVIENNDATFTVAATGTNLSYQWLEDGTDIPGATGSDYVKANAQLGDDGKYYKCRISNSSGSVISDSAKLMVVQDVQPPVITDQPQSISKYKGESATFAVTVTGTSPEYQWRKGTTDLQGETNNILTLQNITNADQGDYSCRVYNSAGSETSDPATLTIDNRPPTLTLSDGITNGATVDVREDELLTFTATASDPDPGDILSLDKDNLPPSATFQVNGVTGTFSYTPDFSVSSNTQETVFNDVTFIATDNDNGRVEVKINIRVLNVNRPPNWSGDSFNVNETVQTNIEVDATDPDGNSLTWELTNAPSYGSVSQTSGDCGAGVEFTYTSQNLRSNQTDNLSIAVSDGIETVTQSIQINISADNDPPVITQVTDISTREDEVSDPLSFTGTDPEGGAVTFGRIENDPDHGTFNPSTLRYDPYNNFHGSDDFSFTIKDDGNLYSAPSTVNVSVSSVNDRPSVDPPHIPSGDLYIGKTKTGCYVTGSDIDGDRLSWSASPSDDADIEVIPATASGSRYDFSIRGKRPVNNKQIRLTASDGNGGSRSRYINIDVLDNTAPTVSFVLVPKSINTGSTETCTFRCYDADGHKLTYNFTHTNAVTISPSSGEVNSSNPERTVEFDLTGVTESSPNNITITVTDPAGVSAFATKNIHVYNNEPPYVEFNSIPESVPVGSEAFAYLSYSDPEDQTLYFVFDCDPEIEISPSNGTLQAITTIRSIEFTIKGVSYNPGNPEPKFSVSVDDGHGNVVERNGSVEIQPPTP